MNLMGIMGSEDDIERNMCLVLCYFAPTSELRVGLAPSSWFGPSSGVFCWPF